MTVEDKHPLQQEDYHLIQDYLITKAVMCLATNASLAEWEHEIAGIQEATGEQWLRRNALLLDYTLARILAAYGRNAHLAEADPAGPTEAFVKARFRSPSARAASHAAIRSASTSLRAPPGVVAAGVGRGSMNCRSANASIDTASTRPAPISSYADLLPSNSTSDGGTMT